MWRCSVQTRRRRSSLPRRAASRPRRDSPRCAGRSSTGASSRGARSPSRRALVRALPLRHQLAVPLQLRPHARAGYVVREEGEKEAGGRLNAISPLEDMNPLTSSESRGAGGSAGTRVKDFRTLQWFDAVAYWNHDAPPAKTDWFPKVMQWQCASPTSSPICPIFSLLSRRSQHPPRFCFFEKAVRAPPKAVDVPGFFFPPQAGCPRRPRAGERCGIRSCRGTAGAAAWRCRGAVLTRGAPLGA